MAGTATVDFGTQTSDIGSDEEDGFDPVPAVGNASPRIVIDTSPPFGSVEEAVIRFGGRGFWVPRPFPELDHPPPSPLLTPPTTTTATTDTTTATTHHTITTVPRAESDDVDKLEERAAAMLKDLDTKEQETLGILKELELTKRLVEDLKLKLPKEVPPIIEPLPQVDFEGKISLTPDIEYNNKLLGETRLSAAPDTECLTNSSDSAGLILRELRQAKLNLYQNTNDLAAIRASVESLSRKMEQEKHQLVHHHQLRSTDHNAATAEINPLVISRELRELNHEAEQFMNTAEAARSEVLKAMSDIEQTKSGLRVIEMRWVAAKKLEEAARAAESLALAEIKCLSSSSCSNETTSNPPMDARISMSVQEYESLLRRKNKDHPFQRKPLPQPQPQPQQPPIRRDSRLLDAREFEGGLRRPTTSIGDILSQKLVLRDELGVEEERRGRQRVSLNQMLRRHRGSSETPPPVKRTEKDDDQSNSKQFFSKRKGLGFVHISLPISKQSKSKIQALNLW